MNTAAILVFAVAALPSLAHADEWNKRWPITGKPELHVNADDAALTIRAGGPGAIEAHVETRGWPIGSGGVQIEERSSGGRVDFTLRLPHARFDFGDHFAKIELRVPADVLANIKMGDGPVTIQDVQGTIESSTGDGPIEVGNFAGILRAKSGDGPVRLSGRFQALDLSMGDGPVRIDAKSGSHVGAAWHVTSGDGPFELRLPGDINANVDIHRGDGPLSVDLPLNNSKRDEHQVRGSLGSGGSEIRVHTGDGPMSIGQS